MENDTNYQERNAIFSSSSESEQIAYYTAQLMKFYAERHYSV